MLEGQYSGRTLFHNLNLQNKNQKAVDIAESQLAQIFKAINVLKPKSEQDMLNKPLVVKVNVKQQEGYEPQNRISYFNTVKSKSSPDTTVPKKQVDPFKNVNDDDIPY